MVQTGQGFAVTDSFCVRARHLMLLCENLTNSSFLASYRFALLVTSQGIRQSRSAALLSPAGAGPWILEVPRTAAMSNEGNGKRKATEETKMLVSFYRTNRRAPLRRNADPGDEAVVLECKLFEWLRNLRKRVRSERSSYIDMRPILVHHSLCWLCTGRPWKEQRPSGLCASACPTTTWPAPQRYKSTAHCSYVRCLGAIWAADDTSGSTEIGRVFEESEEGTVTRDAQSR